MDTGSYEVIHLGGQAAVVVPVADFLRLRALEQAAAPHELKDAEDTAAVLEWKARDAAGQTTFVPDRLASLRVLARCQIPAPSAPSPPSSTTNQEMIDPREPRPAPGPAQTALQPARPGSQQTENIPRACQ